MTYELWRDPLFRELTPWFDDHAEQVEKVLHEAERQNTSLVIKNSSVYNKWVTVLNELLDSNVCELYPLLDRIRQQRNYRNELIVIPADKPGWGLVYCGKSWLKLAL
jgi:hypothetical protein